MNTAVEKVAIINKSNTAKEYLISLPRYKIVI